MIKNKEKWKTLNLDPETKDKVKFVASVLGMKQAEAIKFIISPLFEALVTFDSAECWRDVRLDIPQVNFTLHHGSRRMILRTETQVEVTQNE